MPESVLEIITSRGIRKLNPIQEEAVKKGLFSYKNILVSAPTASGKTLIGELALIYRILQGYIGLYLVPLRALANEKYNEFRIWESLGLRIGISTGDYESPGEYLGKYDLIVATYERFDSILRLKPKWLNRVGVVVIDEFHMIGDSERGPILEMIIARLMRLNIQVIGLSATIGNPGDLANWINGELVYSSWRPVKLVEGVYDRVGKRIIFSDGRIEKIYHRLSNPILNVALQSITNGYQTLVFIHNRRKTEELAFEILDHLNLLVHMTDRDRASEYISKLVNEGPSKTEAERLSKLLTYGVAYHHAGLSSIARRVVEQAFRNRVIKVLFATPTLAAGVNLPARRVIVSIKRYSPKYRRMIAIPVFEYKQMAGRAGRPQYDEYGESIIVDASSVKDTFRKYIYGAIEPVESKLSSERALRIHSLSLIATGEARTLNELISIYKNTLFYYQYRSFKYMRNLLENVLEELVSWDMIRYNENGYSATVLGKITSITYIDPLSTYIMVKNIKEDRQINVLYLLHIVTLTPDYRRSRPYIPARIVDEYEELAWDDASEKLIPEPPSDETEYVFWLQAYVQARMLYDWVNELSEDDIMVKYGIGPGDLYSARETAAWISSSLSKIAYVKNLKSISLAYEKLSKRLEYGVKEDALELVELEGIGRVRARTLIKAGIRSLEDIVSTPINKLASLPGIGLKLAKSIKEQARNIIARKSRI